MKIPSIIICALLLVGCTSSKPKTSLTDAQACQLAMKALPPSKDDAYFAEFVDGTWHVSVLKDVHTSTNPSPRIEVATVRDSDGTVQIIKTP
jgi:PBP1b-binding outer membrane lipoprotein LpoB